MTIPARSKALSTSSKIRVFATEKMAMKWRNVENPRADAFSLAMISVSLTITIIIGIVIGKKIGEKSGNESPSQPGATSKTNT